MILEVKNLVTSYEIQKKWTPIVSDVSFDIGEGKVVGLVGESGCGKSVTSLSIMGLLPKPYGKVASGEILLEGVDLTKLSEPEMQRIRGNKISMIFQEPMTSLNPVLTIGFQVGEVLTRHLGISHQRAKPQVLELLRKVELPNIERLYSEYPHQLSGGMRQRVMIALALALGPKLLIADEPTTALDVTIQAQVLELMKKLTQEQEMSMLLITHDLGVIAEMTQEVIVMYAGKIVEKGLCRDIFNRPRHPYTVGLMKSRPGLLDKSESLQFIKGMVPKITDLPEGCTFAPRCDYAQACCTQDMPGLTGIDDGHFVRCHFPIDG